jgi:hypothetical protein
MTIVRTIRASIRRTWETTTTHGEARFAIRRGDPAADVRITESSGMKKKKPTKNPKGGLTAAGRREYACKDGAHLKPGVKKKIGEMTPQEMRRKGSWAVRFYGRDELPSLTKTNGEPTRFALSAAAWGEPVPKTVAAARRIAAKGKRLLERYQATRKRADRSK